ncbi:hypothetical protein ONZ43_g7461 [Nemania bipapillata]|uniref:Uncharacterized protein n=1 Tax=Nemania bipapillata TaxID=110536 RepID=A0ACC2HRJ4_9PEZI|nr:hypothetical protein ONZ43_g7461 [Nemania bipapillata]
MNRYTPRWSTSSPSPIPEVPGPRKPSPFYATPYSNAPFVDTRPGRGGANALDDDDDDIDYDFDAAESGSDIEVYDDEAVGNDKSGHLAREADDDSNGDSDGDGNDDSSMADLGHDSYQTQSVESCQDSQALEDELWSGIEDVENRDPAVSIHMDDDAMMDGVADHDLTAINLDEHEIHSQGSSVPSEYPSNQPL